MPKLAVILAPPNCLTLWITLMYETNNNNNILDIGTVNVIVEKCYQINSIKSLAHQDLSNNNTKGNIPIPKANF
jgi:hypothetical protein